MYAEQARHTKARGGEIGKKEILLDKAKERFFQWDASAKDAQATAWRAIIDYLSKNDARYL